MKVAFLGTNGWFSTKTGSTPCILVESEKYYIVLDAGEGIYKLDNHIASGKPIFLFLSHFHLDHTFGLHILAKFDLKQGIDIYGQPGTKDTLASLIRHPFTAPPSDLRTKIRFHDINEGTHHVPFRVTCRFLLHADPCFGYRIEVDGKTIVYCTDTGTCENSFLLSQDADLLIHESAAKSGGSVIWPHTNPTQAAELAKKANVKKLVLVHFDASIYTRFDDRKEAQAEARRTFKNTTSARDGMVLEL